jgi:hypothetical protein
MTMPDPSSTSLAQMITEAAKKRARGEPVVNRSDEVARLVIELGAQGDDALERFFEHRAAPRAVRTGTGSGRER